MGSEIVDQIGPDGRVIQDVDTAISPRTRHRLLIDVLPGAALVHVAGTEAVQLGNQTILSKQITHLGRPWPGFKKWIQIPKTWLDVEREVTSSGQCIRFMGVYHYRDVTIFVDFDPSTYIKRKANNSAAHVSTNDLHQAQVHGQFSRVDRNGNRLTSVRADELYTYLAEGYRPSSPRLDVLRSFNRDLFGQGEIDALSAVQAMHSAAWPDTFQGEWPGFFVEFRLDTFLKSRDLGDLVEFQKDKVRGRYDFDLVFKSGSAVEFYGDLKASDVSARESPGNDAEGFARCLAEYRKFWYVIYEHQTVHARNNGDEATIRWNEWKRAVGYDNGKDFNPMSYSRRFKESVRFVKMSVLEVNRANVGLVLGEFAQGRQPDGAARALKVMIKKSNVDNFLIYSEDVRSPSRRDA